MPQNPTSRNIVILCDGTWNREDSSTPTNIAKLYSDLLIHKRLHQETRAHEALQLELQKELHNAAHIAPPLFIESLMAYLKDNTTAQTQMTINHPVLNDALAQLKDLLSTQALQLTKPYLKPTPHYHERIEQLMSEFLRHQQDLSVSLVALQSQQERWTSWLWKKTQVLAKAILAAPKSLYDWIRHFYSDHSQEDYTTNLLNLFDTPKPTLHPTPISLHLLEAILSLHALYQQYNNPNEALAFIEQQIETSNQQHSAANQVIYYDRGVGTWGTITRFFTGATGRGLELNIKQAYTFLCQNYQPGDKLFYFGFSRGAFTVRSLLNMVYRMGLLPKELTHRRYIQMAFDLYQNGSEEEIESFKRAAAIHTPVSEFLGVFDTVGAMGLIEADTYNQWRHGYHDMRVQGVRIAKHAVALDEHREDFAYVPMQKAEQADIELEERIFVGAHSDVGGGYARDKNNQQLSDLAATWMFRSAAGAGLALPSGYFPSGIIPDNKLIWFGSAHAKRHDSRYIFRGTGLRSSFIRPVHHQQTIDPSVVDRIRASNEQKAIQEEDYNPQQLKDKSFIEQPLSPNEPPFIGCVSHYRLFKTKAEQPRPSSTLSPPHPRLNLQ